MYKEFHALHEINIDFDKFIPLKLSHNEDIKHLSRKSNLECNHLGYLVKDGTNSTRSGVQQRWKCQKCKKRFGTDTNEWEIVKYKYKLKLLLYEVFIEGCKQVNIEKRWHIPQEKISRFKKQFVGAIFAHNPRLIIDKKKHLKYGVIYGDETFFGKRGNSNQEVIFCNENFEILSTAPARPNYLKHSILSAFDMIPKQCRDKLRVLVTDGEPSYKSIALHHSFRIIHVRNFTQKRN